MATGRDGERASLGAALRAFLTLPAVAAFAVPIAVSAADAWAGSFLPAGLAVVGAGTYVLVRSVVEFFTEGRGTLAPWNPPRRLVRTGLFARCRNPMYVGVLVTVAGWAVTFVSPLTAAYAVLLAVGFHLRVVRREEPWAETTFPDEWPAYRDQVPRWWPRRQPRSPRSD